MYGLVGETVGAVRKTHWPDSGTDPDALHIFDHAQDTVDARRQASRALRASKRASQSQHIP